MSFRHELFMLPISGGAGKFHFTNVSKLNSAGDIYEKPIILVDDTARIAGEGALDDVDPASIVAVNGPAVLQILEDLGDNPLKDVLFRNDNEITDFSKIIPQQIAFIALFNQLFFLGKTHKPPIAVEFSASFKERFEAISKMLEPESDKAPIKDADATALTDYFTKLQGELKIPDTKQATYTSLRGTIIAGIRGIVAYIQGGVVEGNATTESGFQNEEDEDNDVEEEVNEEFVATQKAEIERVKADAEAELNKKDKEIAGLNEAVEDAGDQLARSLEKIKDLQQTIQELEASEKKLVEKATAKPGQGEVVLLTSEIMKLKRKLAAAQSAARSTDESLRDKMDVLAQEKAALATANEKLTAEIAALKTEVGEAKLRAAAPRVKKPRTRKVLGKNKNDKDVGTDDKVLVRLAENAQDAEPTREGKVRSLSKDGLYWVTEYKDGKPVLKADGKGAEFYKPVAPKDIKLVST
jgi:hypothetical protein